MTGITLDFQKMLEDQEGKPFRSVTKEKLNELNIKTDKEYFERINEFPVVTLANVLDQLFDFTPLPTNTAFRLYSSVLDKIGKAKHSDKDEIEISEEESKALKKIFEKGIDGKPELNRKCAFVYNALDTAIATETLAK